MSEGLKVADMDLEGLIAREWLVANGVGGFASSTAAGMNTRRYHGLLVAAMAPPVRRMVLLSRLEETLVCNGREFYLGCNQYPNVVWPRGHEHLRAFSTEPFPRWAYQGDGWTIEKHLRLVHGENTVLVSYTLLGGANCPDLELRPMMALRGMHDLSYQWNGKLQAEQRSKNHWRLAATSRTPEVFFAHDGAFDRAPNWYLNTIYRREQERGYPGLEDVWCPGVVRVRLSPGQPVYFACSADPFELAHVIGRAGRQINPGILHGGSGSAAHATEPAPRSDQPAPLTPGNGQPAPAAAEAGDPDYRALVRAGEAFVLANRQGESSGASVQYHWNAPSPRFALVAFAGLYLVPRRFVEARSLLLSLVPRLDNGLLPSTFPEDGSEPLYQGADVSLWFVNAVHQYLAYTGDAQTVQRHLMEPVFQIIDSYRKGTGLGIRVDEQGLLVTQADGIPTTWMDSKVGDWVVTPRQGRAVEVNALWYNALCAAADLARRFDQAERADALSGQGRATLVAFHTRFWNDPAGCCYDVVGDGGNDPAVRPNQLLAMSLPFPVLAGDPVLSEERQIRVLDRIRRELLTPFGLRTLAPKDPNYMGHYSGGDLARERAHHNGSAFPWLLGPYLTALFRVRGRDAVTLEEARQLLRPCLDRVRGDGLGQLNELFEGNAPHHPGGAIASPLAAGELLRCYAEDVLGRAPSPPVWANGHDSHQPNSPTNVSHQA